MAETPKTPVATKRTRNAVGTKSYDTTKRTATFTFSNGKSVVVDFGKFPADIQTRIALHGIGAKVGDVYAKAAREATEQGTDAATVAFTLATGEVEKLMAGKWIERTSEGSVKYLDLIEPLLMVADAAKKPTTREKLIKNLSEKNGTELAAIRRNPSVAKAAAEIAAKAPKPSSDALADLF